MNEEGKADTLRSHRHEESVIFTDGGTAISTIGLMLRKGHVFARALHLLANVKSQGIMTLGSLMRILEVSKLPRRKLHRVNYGANQD